MLQKDIHNLFYVHIWYLLYELYEVKYLYQLSFKWFVAYQLGEKGPFKSPLSTWEKPCRNHLFFLNKFNGLQFLQSWALGWIKFLETVASHGAW